MLGIINNYTTHREYLIYLLGNKCSNPYCLVPGGCTDTRCLQLDHINGGGKKALGAPTPNNMYRYYFNNPDEARKNLQVLCANCNWIKRYERKEHGGMKPPLFH